MLVTSSAHRLYLLFVYLRITARCILCTFCFILVLSLILSIVVVPLCTNKDINNNNNDQLVYLHQSMKAHNRRHVKTLTKKETTEPSANCRDQ